MPIGIESRIIDICVLASISQKGTYGYEVFRYIYPN